MLAVYLTELSAYGEVNPDYPYFDAYWREPGVRWPYFLRDGEEVIGFALVRSLSETEASYSMAEFAILPFARGGGRGVEAARQVMLAHPGRWELTIFERNLPAQRFWPRAIAAVGGEAVVRTEEHGETVYRFMAPPPFPP